MADGAPDLTRRAADQMAEQGWALFPRQLPPAEVASIAAEAERIYEICRAVQVRNGVAANMEGTAHHIVGYGGAIDRFVGDLPLYETIEGHFDGKVILLNAGAVLNPPDFKAYTSRPHRDIRAFSPGYPLSLNMLVMLDDFTPENGATRLLPGSHLRAEMASEADFEAGAISITGRAGDILLFDSLVVHAAAPNRSAAARRALTLCFGRPFMKPQMDWPRFLAPEAEAGLTATARQLLGYDARVAASLEEYYQPQERWTFKADQR